MVSNNRPASKWEGRLGRNLPRDEYVSPLMIDLAEELTLKMRQEMGVAVMVSDPRSMGGWLMAARGCGVDVAGQDKAGASDNVKS